MLVGLGSCACTGTTVSLHCWAGGWVVVVVPAQLFQLGWLGGARCRDHGMDTQELEFKFFAKRVDQVM